MSLFAGQTLTFWYRAARPSSLGQSLAPYLLGVVMALGTLFYRGLEPLAALPIYGVGLVCALLGFFGVALAHLGLNLCDDYFDSKAGAVAERERMQDGGFRARMGKCGYLKGTSVGLASVRNVAVFCLLCALILGALVVILRGWPVLLIAAAALVLGLFYAGPPLRLSYHGLGELLIGVTFGPLVVCAAFYIVSGTLTAGAVFASVPVGLLVSNIVTAHAVMDFGPDSQAHRVTFPVLLGSPQRGFWACLVMVVLVYADILAGVLLRFLPVAALLCLLTLPQAVMFLRQLWFYVRGEDRPFIPRPWWGSFSNWSRIQAGGTEWFMAKWLLARNLCMFVSVALAVASLTPWYMFVL
jgi:1,4-dihydroxy-2-naphthoate octaprenyltransferase